MLKLFIFNLFVNGIAGQRRIVNGTEISEGEFKRYMVYLVMAAASPQEYEGWVCGGALVSTQYIITSAACVQDVKHLYAIAGSTKYVADIYNNECANFTKKKITYTCIPQSYNLDYDKLEKWSYIDIAVVKVETPYDFAIPDADYQEHSCDYTPRAIQVNYDNKYQTPGTDAITLGWGHEAKWRTDLDPVNYNQPKLRYASVLIANKEKCIEQYKDYEGMSTVIDNYMICSMEEGNINAQGTLKKRERKLINGCANTTRSDTISFMKLEPLSSCEEASEGDIVFIENTRKNDELNTTNLVQKVEDRNTIVENFKKYNNTNMTDVLQHIRDTRRNGICQNDHGGPLVTWVGAHEVLIGVASVFKVNTDFECIGPFLYTSTQCTGAFLDCILNSDDKSPERKSFCNSSLEKTGFHKIEKTLSWWDHPDGPAEDEKYLIRPFYSQHGI